MGPFFPLSTVRAVERHLLDATAPEQLMRLASRAIADVAASFLPGDSGRILVLAGPGGNGGDGLYAGAFLAGRGFTVDAVLVADQAHEPALAAFRAAGGTVLPAQQLSRLPADVHEYQLLIDAVAGLGSGRPLSEELDAVFRLAGRTPILSVDLPTGVSAETGAAAELCVRATATVACGGLNTGHAVAPECGHIIVAELHPEGMEQSFSHHLMLEHVQHEGLIAQGFLWAARTMEPPVPLPEEGPRTCDEGTFYLHAPAVPERPQIEDPVPGPWDDKYSGGVVGLCAGSETYPWRGCLVRGRCGGRNLFHGPRHRPH